MSQTVEVAQAPPPPGRPSFGGKSGAKSKSGFKTTTKAYGSKTKLKQVVLKDSEKGKSLLDDAFGAGSTELAFSIAAALILAWAWQGIINMLFLLTANVGVAKLRESLTKVRERNSLERARHARVFDELSYLADQIKKKGDTPWAMQSVPSKILLQPWVPISQPPASAKPPPSGSSAAASTKPPPSSTTSSGPPPAVPPMSAGSLPDSKPAQTLSPGKPTSAKATSALFGLSSQISSAGNRVQRFLGALAPREKQAGSSPAAQEHRPPDFPGAPVRL